MPDPIPAEAVQAAAEALARRDFTDKTFEGYARAAIEAAAPVLSAQARQEVAEQIRSIAHDDERWGFVNFRAFIKRHKRLVHGSSGIAVLLAVADEIEGEPHADSC